MVKRYQKNKQPWIIVEILNKMEKQSKLKNQKYKDKQYKRIYSDIQRSCRVAGEKCYNEKCEELEELGCKKTAQSCIRKLRKGVMLGKE